MIDPVTQAKVIFDYLHHRFVHSCEKGTEVLSTLHFNKSSTNVAQTKQNFVVTETMVAEHLSTFVSLINKVKTFMTAAVDCSVQNKFLETV